MIARGAYYNENDPFAAAWLRELIAARLIADGEVDTRSITDVRSDELAGFTQCHFFAGIGGWSLGLRLAGWPDDRAVWTGSCPCQPFSVAGKSDGADDPRHLWPTWFRLIGERRPDVVFGEQVASADGLGWLDRVSTDLEGAGYAVGATDLCAPGVGAFHIRQRLWFVADVARGHRSDDGSRAGGNADDGSSGAPRALADAANADGRRGVGRTETGARTDGERGRRSASGGDAGRRMADDDEQGRDRLSTSRLHERRAGTISETPAEIDAHGAQRNDAHGCGGSRGLADESSGGFGIDGRASRPAGYVDERESARGMVDGIGARLEGLAGNEYDGNEPGRVRTDATGSTAAAGRSSFWRSVEWIPCTDGKARPVEPGSFPLAHGVPGRVGRLRGYGNAIVPQVAAAFVGAYLELDPPPFDTGSRIR